MIYPFEWDNPEHVDLMYDRLYPRIWESHRLLSRESRRPR